ncbi:MAG TPA: helix-hairpin-helix domain-containing protein [Polyangiaceae bacterium]|nr:helix-hairpin-helix domain-containing protein [Polyangiaceae bacterium]
MHTSPSSGDNLGSGTEVRGAGAGAAAASAPSPWRPLVIRAVIGATALLGLSAIGAGSILLGLDGAHASPPTITSASPSASMRAAEPGPPSSEASGSTANGAASANVQAPSQDCPALTEDGRVILNLAGADALRRLPGIGPKRAEAILQLRAKLKRFKRATDLLRVRGIGPKSLARMQSHFVLDPPVGTTCAANAQAAK